MRNLIDVQAMLSRFDAAYAEDGDENVEAVQTALKWVAFGYISDDEITAYLPIDSS